MKTSIRGAGPDDAMDIAGLLTLLGHPTEPHQVAERWDGWAAEGNSALVAVGIGDARIAGLITLHQMHVLHRPHPVGRVTALVVDAPLRGQGVGGALLAAAESAFRHAGCGLVEVTSNRRLSDAHAFYERLGYQHTSLRFAKTLMPPG